MTKSPGIQDPYYQERFDKLDQEKFIIYKATYILVFSWLIKYLTSMFGSLTTFLICYFKANLLRSPKFFISR